MHSDVFNKAKKLGLEDVIGITGIVVERPDDAINKDMITGEIDIEVSDIDIFKLIKKNYAFIFNKTKNVLGAI